MNKGEIQIGDFIQVDLLQASQPVVGSRQITKDPEDGFISRFCNLDVFIAGRREGQDRQEGYNLYFRKHLFLFFQYGRQ